MRLVIEFEEKYEYAFYDLVIATDAVIINVEQDFVEELPEHVIAGIKKSQEQFANGQFKTYDEVKKILADRFLNK